MSNPKLNLKEESSAKKTRSPPKKAKVEQSVPRKKKLKTDAEKTAEKAQHLRFGKAELTPDELIVPSLLNSSGNDPGRAEPVEQGAEAGDVRRPCRPVCGASGG